MVQGTGGHAGAGGAAPPPIGSPTPTARRGKGWVGHALLAVSLLLVAVLLWQARSAWPEARQVLAGLELRTVALAVAAVVAGYLLRLAKWLVLLHAGGSRGRLPDGVLAFLAGLLAALAPAKLGEAWKALALAGRRAEPPERLLAVVAIERGLDLAAIAALLAASLVATTGAWWTGLALAVMACVGLAVACVPRLWSWLAMHAAGRASRAGNAGSAGSAGSAGMASRPSQGPGRGVRLARGVAGFAATVGAIARPRWILPTLALAIAAWGLEGLCVALILDGLGADAGWWVGIAVFTLGTLAGVVSVLPGGLGAAEAGMAAALAASGAGPGLVAAGVLATRLATLGSGGLLGAIAMPAWFLSAPRRRPAGQ